ncbi:class I SAM-dependent methyltransferase [Labrys neptuniae]
MDLALLDIDRYPTLSRIRDAQIAAFPQCAGSLARRFRDATAEEFDFLEALARDIDRIVGRDLRAHCADYKFITDIVLEEEIYFRRENRYRLSTFAEALEKVYSNREYMTRYMNGLLMSQLWWSNHSAVMQFFKEVYLSGNKPGYRHLEIGPGHGLFLEYAAMHPHCGSATGWDVSPASLDLVRQTLSALDCQKPVSLELVNMFDAPTREFDSIVFSEVLEHLEDPAGALKSIASLLAPGGRTFINAPVNSPAPDHLSLFRSPEEIVRIVEEAGLRVERTLFAPTAGSTLDRARRMSLAISTVVVASNPQE